MRNTQTKAARKDVNEWLGKHEELLEEKQKPESVGGRRHHVPEKFYRKQSSCVGGKSRKRRPQT
jgi:hypothetical protein